MHPLVTRLVRVGGGVLTYDFCPWANRFVYWMKQPIAALSLAMVAALSLAVFVRPVALVAFAAILVVVGLGYLWPAVAVRGLSAHLRFMQTRVAEGEEARATVRVRNAWPWPVWGLAIEGDVGGPASVALAQVPGWSTAEFGWPVTPRCRGVHPRQPPRLITGFPFGLRLASRPVEVEHRLLVWPRIVPLETLLDAAETRPSDEFFSAVRVGESGDIAGTRPFRSGDSLRRVHWAQTARTGAMVVSERQAPVLSAVRVVFDPDLALHEGDGPDSTLEWSIRIAASICAAYQRQHAAVECCHGHETIRLAHGDVGLRAFLDALARFTPPTAADPLCPSPTEGRCGRIHDRACGAFQITVTSARALARRVEHRQVHGEQLFVVIDRPSDATGDPGPLPARMPGRMLRLEADPHDDVLTVFRRRWRSICREG
jgi:uncharacterized protein (DUF58 family)